MTDPVTSRDLNFGKIHIPPMLLKVFRPFLLATFLPLTGFAQPAHNLAATPDPDKPVLTVETSCGECNYGLPGYDCDVAVRLPQEDGASKAYYVDGVSIGEYGHPHDENGFCVAVRKAEVQGELVDGRFEASYFKLLPLEPAKPKAVDQDQNPVPDQGQDSKGGNRQPEKNE